MPSGFRPCPHQVAQRFLLRARHRYRGRLPGPVAARQLLGITSVGLDPLACLFWNQTRGNYFALHVELGELPREAVSCRACFVTGPDLALLPQLLDWVSAWTSRPTYNIFSVDQLLVLCGSAPLFEAALQGPFLALYIYEPSLWTAPDAAAQHWNLVAERLQNLRRCLPVAVRVGELLPVLDEIRLTMESWDFGRTRRPPTGSPTSGTVPFADEPRRGGSRLRNCPALGSCGGLAAGTDGQGPGRS